MFGEGIRYMNATKLISNMHKNTKTIAHEYVAHSQNNNNN